MVPKGTERDGTGLHDGLGFVFGFVFGFVPKATGVSPPPLQPLMPTTARLVAQLDRNRRRVNLASSMDALPWLD